MFAPTQRMSLPEHHKARLGFCGNYVNSSIADEGASIKTSPLHVEDWLPYQSN